MAEVAGKVAVVTGGASGIGRALALALAGQGAAGVCLMTESQYVERMVRSRIHS